MHSQILQEKTMLIQSSHPKPAQTMPKIRRCSSRVPVRTHRYALKGAKKKYSSVQRKRLRPRREPTSWNWLPVWWSEAPSVCFGSSWATTSFFSSLSLVVGVASVVVVTAVAGFEAVDGAAEEAFSPLEVSVTTTAPDPAPEAFLLSEGAAEVFSAASPAASSVTTTSPASSSAPASVPAASPAPAAPPAPLHCRACRSRRRCAPRACAQKPRFRRHGEDPTSPNPVRFPHGSCQLPWGSGDNVRVPRAPAPRRNPSTAGPRGRDTRSGVLTLD
jgi:hypothetical protein